MITAVSAQKKTQFLGKKSKSSYSVTLDQELSTIKKVVGVSPGIMMLQDETEILVCNQSELLYKVTMGEFSFPNNPSRLSNRRFVMSGG